MECAGALRKRDLPLANPKREPQLTSSSTTKSQGLQFVAMKCYKTKGNILTFVSIRGVLELSEVRPHALSMWDQGLLPGCSLPVAKSLGTSFTGPPPSLDPALAHSHPLRLMDSPSLPFSNPNRCRGCQRFLPSAWAGCSEKPPPSCCCQPWIPHYSWQWSAFLRFPAARCVG